MEKELIIIALIVLVIYFYYQSQNRPIITIENPLNTQLESQVNYYQTLYQQRIEKDVGDAEKVNNLEKQLTILEEIINKPVSHVGTQTELSEKDIINLNKSAEYYRTLAEQRKESKEESEKQLTLVYQDLKTISETAEELETLLETNQKETNENLRKINVLFDENAKDYQVIDFNGLYALLVNIAERERERAK